MAYEDFEDEPGGCLAFGISLLVMALVLVVALGVCAREAEAHDGTRWGCIAHYESTHRWHVNTGNGYYGGLQFSFRTWRYYGGPRYSGNTWPHRATKAEQIHIAKRVAWHGYKYNEAQGGYAGWPNTWGKCS